MTEAVPQIFDAGRQGAVRRRAAARAASGSAASWLGEAMAEDLLDRLDFLRLMPERALITGRGTAVMAQGWRDRGWPAPQIARNIDLERPLTFGNHDLIAVLGELETVNDLPGALLHLRAALAPGGLMLASMVGAGSLPRLRQALLAADGDRPAARLHPAIDARAASALLQRAGFARQVSDHFTLAVRYPALERLIADLRDQALGSVLRDRAPPLSRSGWLRARQAFAVQADSDGRISEHFEIVTLSAWRS